LGRGGEKRRARFNLEAKRKKTLLVSLAILANRQKGQVDFLERGKKGEVMKTHEKIKDFFRKGRRSGFEGG